MLTGKKAVLGITGSIAAYKMANVASMLAKQNCDVHVVMTEHAAQFIAPLTFEALTKNPCLTSCYGNLFLLQPLWRSMDLQGYFHIKRAGRIFRIGNS